LKDGEKLTEYYPIFLKLKDKLCLVIGGGRVAERKVLSLLKCGAKVKVISPELTPKLKDLFEKGEIIWEKRPYKKGDLERAFLVIAATNDPVVQEEVFKEAEEKNIPCNVVDKPEYCSFIVPSTIERGELVIAISTSGASPALARRLREFLETTFGKEYEIYLSLMRRIREKILKMELSSEEKEEKLQRLALSPLPIYLKYGNFELIKTILEKEGFSELISEFFSPDKASKDT
jgi:precorrin-2 dehydrogenase/sirohydrochlorin ferrochelatase